jgi:multicomponent Na+:H+ antiporter subunit G
MIDTLAAVALLTGSLLVALGAIGLLRFPDVFTRMHAATKAATVGVIGTTAAAALEAATLSGVLVLLLVIGLLFLSGPLGMSLLARAAYHDPETPRSPRTLELETRLPIPESTPVSRTRGNGALLALWLLAVWVAAFGSFRPNVLLSGAVAAGAVAFAGGRVRLRRTSASFHPTAILRFVGHFVIQMVLSTWDVIRTLRVPADEIRPAVLEVSLRVRTRNEVTLLMNAISFTPGTVALELHDRRLYVHVLSTDDHARVLAGIATMEDRIMAAFGSRQLDASRIT